MTLNGVKPCSLQKGIHSAIHDLPHTANDLVSLEVNINLKMWSLSLQATEMT